MLLIHLEVKGQVVFHFYYFRAVRMCDTVSFDLVILYGKSKWERRLRKPYILNTYYASADKPLLIQHIGAWGWKVRWCDPLIGNSGFSMPSLNLICQLTCIKNIPLRKEA